MCRKDLNLILIVQYSINFFSPFHLLEVLLLNNVYLQFSKLLINLRSVMILNFFFFLYLSGFLFTITNTNTSYCTLILGGSLVKQKFHNFGNTIIILFLLWQPGMIHSSHSQHDLGSQWFVLHQVWVLWSVASGNVLYIHFQYKPFLILLIIRC